MSDIEITDYSWDNDVFPKAVRRLRKRYHEQYIEPWREINLPSGTGVYIHLYNGHAEVELSRHGYGRCDCGNGMLTVPTHEMPRMQRYFDSRGEFDGEDSNQCGCGGLTPVISVFETWVAPDDTEERLVDELADDLSVKLDALIAELNRQSERSHAEFVEKLCAEARRAIADEIEYVAEMDDEERAEHQRSMSISGGHVDTGEVTVYWDGSRCYAVIWTEYDDDGYVSVVEEVTLDRVVNN